VILDFCLKAWQIQNDKQLYETLWSLYFILVRILTLDTFHINIMVFWQFFAREFKVKFGVE